MVKKATRRPRTGSTGRGRNTVGTTSRPGLTALAAAVMARTTPRPGKWRLALREHQRVAEQQPVGAEKAGDVVHRLARSRDAQRRVGEDRRHHGAAALDHRQRGGAPVQQRQRLTDVVVERHAGEPAPAAPAPHCGHAGEHRVLVAVAGRVTAGAGGGEQFGGAEPVAAADELRLRRPATAHGKHDDAAVRPPGGVDPPRQPAAHGGLADALAGADHGEGRRGLQPGELLRAHLGVRGHVGRALGEGRAHEEEPFAIPDDRLVREVDECFGPRRAQRGAHALEHLVRGRGPRLDCVQPRHPDLGRQRGQPLRRLAPRVAGAGVAAQLLPPAGEDAGLHGVGEAEPRDRRGDHGRVVFAVDEHDGPRQTTAYRLSSSGTGQMYLSNEAVDGTKSMSVSSPWNGYLRATCTRSSSIRMRL